MIQFETTKATILFVEVPEDARNFLVRNDVLSFSSKIILAENKVTRQLSEGIWQFITILKDASEEQANELVDAYGLNIFHNYHFKSQIKEVLLPFALLSLHSLANSLGVKGNCAVLVKGGA